MLTGNLLMFSVMQQKQEPGMMTQDCENITSPNISICISACFLLTKLWNRNDGSVSVSFLYWKKQKGLFTGILLIWFCCVDFKGIVWWKLWTRLCLPAWLSLMKARAQNNSRSLNPPWNDTVIFTCKFLKWAHHLTFWQEGRLSNTFFLHVQWKMSWYLINTKCQQRWWQHKRSHHLQRNCAEQTLHQLVFRKLNELEEVKLSLSQSNTCNSLD